MEVTYLATLAAVLTGLAAFALTGFRSRLDLPSVIIWAGVAVAGTALTVVVARYTLAEGLGAFGVMNVVFRQLVVGLPLAAALICLRAWRRGWAPSTSVWGRVTVFGALLLAPLGLWMGVIEPNRLVVRHDRLTAAGVPPGQTLRIGVISDLQMGDDGPGAHEQAAVAALNAQHPDIVLIAGDIAQSSTAAFDRNLGELRALLASIEAPGGVFLVQGDVDERSELAALSQGTGVRWLSDQIATVTVAGTTVAIAGVDLAPTAPGARRIAEELEARPARDEVRILLGHRPDVVDLLPAEGSRTDLVVAGHTHGGQIALPFVGPLMTLSSVPRAVAAGGLHSMGDRQIYVSSGVGVERHQAPKIRLLDPPSVGILTVTHG